MLNQVGQSTPSSPILGGAFSPDEIRAMQRAIVGLFGRWAVTDADAALLLGGLSAKTFRRWKDGDYGRVTRDLADRMSHLLGIHKALRILFADPERGYRWMTAPNDAFDGQSALDVLRRGGMSDIIRVRHYLNSTRGGW